MVYALFVDCRTGLCTWMAAEQEKKRSNVYRGRECSEIIEPGSQWIGFIIQHGARIFRIDGLWTRHGYILENSIPIVKSEKETIEMLAHLVNCRKT